MTAQGLGDLALLALVTALFVLLAVRVRRETRFGWSLAVLFGVLAGVFLLRLVEVSLEERGWEWTPAVRAGTRLVLAVACFGVLWEMARHRRRGRPS